MSGVRIPPPEPVKGVMLTKISETMYYDKLRRVHKWTQSGCVLCWSNCSCSPRFPLVKEERNLLNFIEEYYGSIDYLGHNSDNGESTPTYSEWKDLKRRRRLRRRS